MKTFLRAVGLAMLAALAFTGAARAHTSEPGPYYAMPSWDQKLPVSSRFVVLTNWGSAAVLDRETGLVWQQSPSAATASLTWGESLMLCLTNNTGGRFGWRLPSFEEIMTLVDPGTRTFFPGAPFTVPNNAFFWTATTDPVTPSDALVLSNTVGVLVPSSLSKSTPVVAGHWCVRSHQGTQNPQ